MKRMLVTASESLTKVPSEYAKWYRVQSFSEIEDEMGAENAQEYLDDQKEMLQAYDSEILGFVTAKDKYYDALSENGLDHAVVIKESNGTVFTGFFVHDSFIPLSIDEIEMCIGDDEWDDDADVEGATSEDLQKRFTEYTKKQNQVGNQLDNLQSQAKKKFGFGKSRVTADIFTPEQKEALRRINERGDTSWAEINSPYYEDDADRAYYRGKYSDTKYQSSYRNER